MEEFRTLKYVKNIKGYYHISDEDFKDSTVAQLKRQGLDQHYSVRRIQKSGAGNTNDLVKQELSLLQKLTDHPHMIEVKELLQDQEYYYIATEVC